MHVRLILNGVDDNVEPALYLKGLIESGKVQNFLGCLDNCNSMWETMCALENDFLEFRRKNRYCSPPQDFCFQVGHCETLPQVPAFNGWGKVGAWLVYDEYVIVVDPPGREVAIWYDMDFYDKKEATIRGTFPFADDSAIQMNKILKAFVR